jgi:Alkaline phosphatase
LLLGQKKKVAV